MLIILSKYTFISLILVELFQSCSLLLVVVLFNYILIKLSKFQTVAREISLFCVFNEILALIISLDYIVMLSWRFQISWITLWKIYGNIHSVYRKLYIVYAYFNCRESVTCDGNMNYTVGVQKWFRNSIISS